MLKINKINVHALSYLYCDLHGCIKAPCTHALSMVHIQHAQYGHCPEEVGHDHVHTQSGRVAPYIILYKT